MPIGTRAAHAYVNMNGPVRTVPRTADYAILTVPILAQDRLQPTVIHVSRTAIVMIWDIVDVSQDGVPMIVQLIQGSAILRALAAWDQVKLTVSHAFLTQLQMLTMYVSATMIISDLHAETSTLHAHQSVIYVPDQQALTVSSASLELFVTTLASVNVSLVYGQVILVLR